MLIPLGTDRPLHRPTVVTYMLIAANVAVFAVQHFLLLHDPEGAYVRFMAAGQIWGERFRWWNLITSAFLHVGAYHIVGNMLVLWVFGPNIEDRLGRIWFLIFYLLGGAASGALHAAFSDAPAVGASGAIAAVTGMYLVMFPRTLVKCFYIFGLALVQLPAWWFIGFAVVWDFIMQSTGRLGGVGAPIAHLAHIGGYVFGIGVAFVLLWLKIVPREPYDLFSQGRQAMRRRAIKSAAVSQDRAITQHWEKARSGGQPTDTNKLAAARAEVARRIGSGDWAGASAAYKMLANSFANLPNATLLSRKHQYDLGNWMYQAGDTEGAVFAYERFLEGYPKDSEAGHVRLLLGLIHARSLNDPIRAKALIRQAIEELRDGAAVDMAKRELAALG